MNQNAVLNHQIKQNIRKQVALYPGVDSRKVIAQHAASFGTTKQRVCGVLSGLVRSGAVHVTHTPTHSHLYRT